MTMETRSISPLSLGRESLGTWFHDESSNLPITDHFIAVAILSPSLAVFRHVLKCILNLWTLCEMPCNIWMRSLERGHNCLLIWSDRIHCTVITCLFLTHDCFILTILTTFSTLIEFPLFL